MFALVVAYLGFSPTGRYLVRAAIAEAGILARRQSIEELVRDSTTPPETARRLRLVLDARRFAQDSIGFRANESFTTYSRLDRDTLVLVLSGAYRDRLVPKTWWFPIVGRVPYKGFFDFVAARAAAKSLGDEGFDVYLRPASAFSTLGWFNDPVLSTTLRADTLDLANTVIHELTHNTFYAPGQAVFNESFANFVGSRGSAWFFRSRGDSAAAAEVERRWLDEKVLAAFWTRLYHSVDSAFKAHPADSAARLVARDTLYARARHEAVNVLAGQLRTISPRALERMRIDNAALLAQRIYNTELDQFDRVWEEQGGNVRLAIDCIIAIAKRSPKDPYAGLRSWVDSAEYYRRAVDRNPSCAGSSGNTPRNGN